jgi:hypothetical protein
LIRVKPQNFYQGLKGVRIAVQKGRKPIGYERKEGLSLATKPRHSLQLWEKSMNETYTYYCGVEECFVGRRKSKEVMHRDSIYGNHIVSGFGALEMMDK